ncbi:MAG TPA: VOC family protein [Pseudonocardia sp.]|nr:VOC family protein [Pseudonocardia sp.]
MDAIGRLSLVALDCPEPRALAEFYSALLGWPVDPESGDGWVQLVADSDVTLAFQRVEGYREPEWPGQEHPQQLHLDIDVPDLDAGEERVIAIGARKHGVQPKPESFRVYVDPAGHPFCLVRA